MAEYNVIQKKRNAANTDWDTIYPVTKAENVMMGPGMGAISEYTDKSSYMAFVANLNTDSLDAAFGKGNEDRMIGLGRQLKMVSAFKNDVLKAGNYEDIHKLSDFQFYEDEAYECLKNEYIRNLIIQSPYACDVFGAYYPLSDDVATPPKEWVVQNVIDTGNYNFQDIYPAINNLTNLVVQKTGLYTIQVICLTDINGSTSYKVNLETKCYVNDVEIYSSTTGLITTAQNINLGFSKLYPLNKNDVVRVTIRRIDNAQRPIDNNYKMIYGLSLLANPHNNHYDDYFYKSPIHSASSKMVTDKFVAHTTGDYLLTMYIRIATSEYGPFVIRKNADVIVETLPVGTSGIVERTVSLNKGDTLYLTLQNVIPLGFVFFTVKYMKG